MMSQNFSSFCSDFRHQWDGLLRNDGRSWSSGALRPELQLIFQYLRVVTRWTRSPQLSAFPMHFKSDPTLRKKLFITLEGEQTTEKRLSFPKQHNPPQLETKLSFLSFSSLLLVYAFYK